MKDVAEISDVPTGCSGDSLIRRMRAHTAACILLVSVRMLAGVRWERGALSTGNPFLFLSGVALDRSAFSLLFFVFVSFLLDLDWNCTL